MHSHTNVKLVEGSGHIYSGERGGGVQGKRIKMCCFSYLDSEQCLKKVVSSYYSLVYMCCQNLCTYTSNSEDEPRYLHTEKDEAPIPQHCLLSPAIMASFALIGTSKSYIIRTHYRR